MKGKQIGGLIAIIIGVVLIVFASYERNRVSNAKSSIHEGSALFGNSKGGQMATGMLNGKASEHDTTLMVILVSGIVIAVVGAGLMFCCCGKKKK